MTGRLHARPISQEEFDAICQQQKSGLPEGTRQIAWFRSSGGNYAAVLLRYEEEQHWGTLIVNASDGRCRAVQVERGIRSRHRAAAHIEEEFGLLEVDAQTGSCRPKESE